MRDHARHGDAQTEGRVVHGLGDAVRQDALLVGLREALRGDRGERVDQTGHGSEKADQRCDVRERPESSDSFFDGRLQVAELFAQRGVDFVGTLVRMCEAALDELQNRVVACVAELDGAVDVARRDQLFDLREELLRVDAVTPELKRESLDDDRHHDRGADEIQQKKPRVFFERSKCPRVAAARCSLLHQKEKTHP